MIREIIGWLLIIKAFMFVGFIFGWLNSTSIDRVWDGEGISPIHCQRLCKQNGMKILVHKPIDRIGCMCDGGACVASKSRMRR